MLKKGKSHCSKIVPIFFSHSVLGKESRIKCSVETERRYNYVSRVAFWEIGPHSLLKGVMSLKTEFFITTVVITS